MLLTRIYISSDMAILLENLVNDQGQAVTGATVTAQLVGGTVDETINNFTEVSTATYRGYIENTIAIEEGVSYTLTVTIVSETSKLTLRMLCEGTYAEAHC